MKLKVMILAVLVLLCGAGAPADELNGYCLG